MRAALLSLLLLCTPHALHADEPAPAWERVGLVPLPTDECQELHIGRVGRGLLELRYFTEPLPRPTGPDLKTTGASLLLAANDLERASFLLYDASGIYPRTSRLPAPIRWQRHGSRLCIASGSLPVTCGSVAGEILGTLRIAFGPGWETSIAGCAPFPMAERPVGAWVAWLLGFTALAALVIAQRPRNVWLVVASGGPFACAAVAALDPWLLPSVALLPAAAIAAILSTAWALIERRRPWTHRIPRIALGFSAISAIVCVPYPVWSNAPVKPVVPPLWFDTANWHPRAAHQSLEFRGRRLADVASGEPTWLVLGGSVAFGEGVEASQTFTAVAQELLRAAGDRTNLLNAGAQGWNIQNVDRFLVDFGDTLPVTGIVVASILNNATLPIVAPMDASCERSLLRAWLCNTWRSQLLLPWLKVILPKPHNPDRDRRILRSLLERELGLGRRVVLLDEASEMEGGILQPWDFDLYREIAREVGEEFDVPFHPVTDVAAELRPDERFLDRIHPAAAMHALLGRRLYEILREQ